MSAAETLLAVDRVAKHFGGLAALSDVSIAISRGEIFGLIGQKMPGAKR
jgi:ABC-type branched-subunit amino acid transport system ATPase component